VRSKIAVLLVTLAGSAFPAIAPAADQPRIREIEIRGAEAYDRAAVLRIIRLKPGDTLWRDAAAVAQALETRYHIQGFPAARVTGSFDPATEVLALDVDEGRLVSVAVSGLDGKAERHALEVLDLETGQVLRDRDVTKAVRRLEKASDGSLEADLDTPDTVERVPGGGRLVVRLRSVGGRIRFRIGSGGAADYVNRVDGFTPWIGAEATVHDRVSYNHLQLYGRIGYGFASKDPRFVVGALRPVGANRRVTLGYEFHDLADSDDSYRLVGFEEAPSWIITSKQLKDYYQRRGHEAYGFVRLGRRAQLGLTWRSDEFRSLDLHSDGVLFLHKKDTRPNPGIDEGTLRSGIATLRWANSGELFGTGQRERDAFLLRSLYDTRLEEGQALRAEASFEWSDPDVLGGDFSFRRFIGTVRGSRDVGSGHAVRARVLVGLGSGDVPLQRRFALGDMGTLRGRDLKAIAGDNTALVTGEWLVRLPSPFPGLVAFYDGGTAWDSGGDREWKSDVGAGVEWPAGPGFFFRGDLAFPLGRDPGEKSARFTWRLRFPF
jgi:surface antigen Omp85-like protein/surface antigen-like variable number repeat protein